ncbi:recombination regulator RecX [Gilvimarinus agarilyticus]|uniref:regulatory protein RecX n=1 Tax=unclassified Gilvimarinus TaxID=2642066 RepID=UPI001C08E148|nr:MULTISPECIES: regulatory protein RecX [unclassified Gilvimarinus]MBU2884779.1 recombination regulator RecX [Gilvimarinus agarilyticus]MDO6569829.1 regulatory protein RecX [Gilvimarinus sp. 2_MG-2023]MDO6747049.1 regulatory protein RecX [Gilvimarinus sp. 1_MG-2023]
MSSPGSSASREQVRNSALASLTRREHGTAELQSKLTAKFGDADLAADAIEWLLELGYLDDIRFTEMFVRSSIAKGRGPLRISQELRQKGVDSSLIEQALAEADADWRELARERLERKFPRPATDLKEKAKRMRYLQYRGFFPDDIFALVNAER